MESKFAVRVVTPVAPFELEPAPAQLPVPVQPKASAASLLELGLSLERTMYRATESHGELTPSSALTLFQRFGVPWLATALGVGVLATTAFYGGERLMPLPFIAGVVAGFGSAFGLQSVAERLEARRRMSVVDDQAAAPLVQAFSAGDTGQRELVAALAARWGQRMSNHTIGGVYVRRQLEGLQAQVPEASRVERARTTPLLNILRELHDDRGAAKKQIDAESLRCLAKDVKALPEEERQSVARLLIDRLYVKEKPKFRCSDHSAVQQLLYDLVSHLPLDRRVTTRAN